MVESFIARYCTTAEAHAGGTLHRGFTLRDSLALRLPAGAVKHEAWGDGPARRVWVCADERAIITYCEGDLDVTRDPDAASFRARLASAAAFYGAAAGPPARFPLGRVVLTPGALDLLTGAGRAPRAFIERHAAGDWGDVPPEDAEANERSIADGSRILSSYAVGDAHLWLITAADRSSTCLLLREEY